MKTRCMRLDLESFAEHYFCRVFGLETAAHGQPAQVIPKRSHKRV